MLSVKTRQQYLKNLEFYKGEIDGIEKEKTRKSYKDLQKKYFVRKSDIDGIYGKNTEMLLTNAERIRKYVTNFKLEELKCSCGGRYCTGYPALLNKKLLKNIQKMRNKHGNFSTYKCIKCNWKKLYNKIKNKSLYKWRKQMKNLSLSKKDLANLKELFEENYLILKQTKKEERKTSDNETKLLLKEIRTVHQENLLTIMKLLDEKERIL